MTATEVLERKEEFVRTIGPVFGQLEADYIAAVVERSFNIMLRGGAFSDLPDGLDEIKFTYASPVEQARKQIEAAGAARAFELLAPFVQMDPTIMDNFNADEMARDVPDIFGTPGKWMRPKEDVEEMRQARAQQQQAAAMLQGMDQAAGVAEKVGRSGMLPGPLIEGEAEVVG